MSALTGQSVEKWYSSNNQIALSRGMKAFLAINKEEYDMAGHFLTGLPIGDYCDIISGIYVNNACSGPGISNLTRVF